MEAPNPYQSPDTLIEGSEEPTALPATAYVSAGCSAMFVFFGGGFVLAIVVGGLLLPPGSTHPLLAYAVVGVGAALLAAVSGWETLRLERRRREKARRKRQKGQQEAAPTDVPPSDVSSR